MKLHVVSFGCQMSVADGEEMARPLAARGFQPTPELQDADAVLLNTCTVRQHAEDKAVSYIGRLRPWKDERPERFVIVAGCAAERLGAWIQERFPYVDLVVGAKSIEEYPTILERALKERFDWQSETAAAFSAPAQEPEAPKTAAYVTIMRGCNYSCAYCIVPAVRGRELYRPPETIIDEIKARAREGAREIMLLGQTVNSYYSGIDFADLLRRAAEVDGIDRIRFMSPHPFFLGDRLIEAIAQTKKVARHMHLPLQSGSDRMLKAMRRNYTAERFLERAAKLKAAVPELEFTTDVIVGFPGETERDFQATLEIVRRLDPVSAYCFKFSPRPGTQAADLSDQLDEPEIEARLARLNAVTDSIREKHLAGYVGRSVEVLFEDKHFGRTNGFFKVRTDFPGAIGERKIARVSGHSKTVLQAEA